jgi:hydroxymethylbilane synthase
MIRLGTRKSTLAIAQTELVADQLRESGHSVELVPMSSRGDLDRSAPVNGLGVGVYVNALREALLAGEIDVAVHSLKDLPTEPLAALSQVVVGREDPRDALVSSTGLTLGELPVGSRIGTGSARRAAQLQALGLDYEVVPIRGNVDTRLAMVGQTVDAVVVAAAGLRRLGCEAQISELIDPLQMLPAPGQGALVIETLVANPTHGVVATLRNRGADLCTRAERALLMHLEAGCSAAVGALAEVVEGDSGEELWLRGGVWASDGWGHRLSQTGLVDNPEGVGKQLAERLLADGANELLNTELKRQHA